MITTRTKQKAGLSVVEEYDVAADARRRISLRRSKIKYFRVGAVSNGSFLLKLRVLAPPQTFFPRVLKLLDQSAKNLKRGGLAANRLHAISRGLNRRQRRLPLQN
jgi:hypothetical protein